MAAGLTQGQDAGLGERRGRTATAGAAEGPHVGRGIRHVDDEAIERAVNANLLTSVRLVREAVPYMRAPRWGRICLITSYSIKQPIPTLSATQRLRCAGHMCQG